MTMRDSNAKNDQQPPYEGVDLYGADGAFGMPGDLWCLLLGLAKAYGWKPAGTLAPDPEWVWDDDDAIWMPGSYYPPRCQRIALHDAQNFTDALLEIVANVPEIEDSGGDENPYAGWAQPASNIMDRLATIRPVLRALAIHLRQEIWVC